MTITKSYDPCEAVSKDHRKKALRGFPVFGAGRNKRFCKSAVAGRIRPLGGLTELAILLGDQACPRVPYRVFCIREIALAAC